MKLIRLTSTSQTAYFDNTFNDDIVIKPNGKVALHSLSTETAPNKIELNSTNNVVEFSVQTGQSPATFEAELLPGIYDKTNQEVLFTTMYQKMNEELNGNADFADQESFPTGVQVGMQWNAEVSTGDFGESGKFYAGYKIANLKDMSIKETDKLWANSNITETSPAGTKRYKMTATATETYLQSLDPFTQGCGHYSTKLSVLPGTDGGDTVSQGVFIGLTQYEFDAAYPPTKEECIVGIQAPFNGSGVIVWEDGEASTPSATETCNQGDRLGLEFAAGLIFPVIYDSTDGNVRQLIDAHGQDEFSYNFRRSDMEGEIPLYLIVILENTTTSPQIDTVRWTPDAWAYETAHGTPPNKHTHLGVGPSNPNVTSRGYMLLSTELSGFLGYPSVRRPQTGLDILSTKSFFWGASKLYSNSTFADSFYVELLSNAVDGYDGLTSGKKNILAVIPQSDSDSSILYSPSFPVFLDMNNNYEMTLRTIRARLLNADGSSVQTDGLSVLTLLFDA